MSDYLWCVTRSAVRLNNDVNGNPRYYISAEWFRNQSGELVRPRHCKKFRGKISKGWVFTSFSLESDLERIVNDDDRISKFLPLYLGIGA